MATLDAAGLIAFKKLQRDAAYAVTARLFAMFAADRAASGEEEYQRCADDVA